MYDTLCILILHRILVQSDAKYKDQAKNVLSHIPSKFSEEMASKSVVVGAYHYRNCNKSSLGTTWHNS